MIDRKHPRLTRRLFTAGGALAILGAAGGATLLGRRAWAQGAAPSKRPVLVCVFQRGGVDGLSMVVPHAEREYYDLRTRIAIAQPKKAADAAIDLDGRFGLHPKLAALEPAWRAGELAIVHAVGSPHPTRSHFDAQDFMESGTPGETKTPDGWIGRCLRQRSAGSSFRGVAVGDPGLPRSLRGSNATLAIESLDRFGLRGPARAQRKLEQGFASLYGGGNDLVTRTGRSSLAAMDRIRALQEKGYEPDHGAEYARNRIARPFRDVAQLIKAGLGVEAAFISIGGWDTHARQGGADGQLARRLAQLGDAMAAFRRDLGAAMEHVVVMTTSEFGRTVAQNGSGGTDHGHGTAMMLMGGPVAGGKVVGRWPGLAKAELHEGRDLAVATDFRDVFGEVAAKHLGAARLEQVFPGHPTSPKRFVGVLR